MPRARTILLVEDNPADARLTLEAFRHSGQPLDIEVVEDGEAALERLRDTTRALPALVLLDLNLPGIHGREVLDEIRADHRLALLPVCILSTSRSSEDIQQAYANHTNCYVVKPIDLTSFRTVVQQIERFWFDTAELPELAPTAPAPT